MASANLAAVLTLDDRASAGLVNVAQRTQTAGEAFRRAVPSLATFGSSMASLLITTGALNSETGRYVTIALSMSSAIASMLPALGAMVRTLQSAGVAMNVLNAASGFRVPLVAGSIAAGVATAGFFTGRHFAGRSDANAGLSVHIDARGAQFSRDEDIREFARRVDSQMRR